MPDEAPQLAEGAGRLLDAAECLVAVRGPHVSLREITLAAGHRNSSAVAYHFGDRQALMDAVWCRRTVPTNARRAQLLSALTEQGRSEDVAGLVEAHVLPIVEVMAARQPSFWARFNEARLAQLPLEFVEGVRADLMRFPTDQPLSVLLTVFDRLARLVEERGAGTHRVALYVRFVITSLASWEREAEAGRTHPQDLTRFAADVQAMGVALLLARPDQGPPLTLQK